MIEVHPRQFCRIQNPVMLGEDGNPLMTVFHQVRVNHGETEIRFYRDKPFPLYPGEKLLGNVQKQTIIRKDTALLVQALRDFEDSRDKKKKHRKAGEQWLVKGPKTYFESVYVNVVSTVRSKIIKPNCAMKLQAQRSLVDANGVKRHAGEQWLIRKEGSYLPRLFEQIVEIIKGIVITHKEALKVRSTKSFTDIYDIDRKAGEEWLVTNNMTQIHIIDVYEESVKKVYATTLSNR